MLKQLRIENFKGWKDTGIIRMAPITLFFGANSSGKSSIGQFLMMLKQTAESQDRKIVFYPGGKNSAVELGSFQKMVFHRDPSNKIEFEYSWSLPELLKIKDPVSESTYIGDTIDFNAKAGMIDDIEYVPCIENFCYTLLSGDKKILTIGLKKQLGTKNGSSQYEAFTDKEKYNLVRQKGRPWSFKGTVRFYGFPDEMVAYHQNASFVKDLSLTHEKLFRSISYLGPLRTKAERLYSWTGIKPESVGYAGEHTVPAILAARRRQIGLGPKRPTLPFEEIIALKLKEMGLIQEFKVEKISDQRQEYEVKIQTKGSDDWVDLPDVGFGLSQVLPVLAQCFYAPANSIIIMEQPEIHLHPSAQSALADVMIDVINSRENYSNRNIQLIIETHSEHFLRRLQRRIAENKVSQDNVSAYFADISTKPATLNPLEIDLFGNILNWPDNFFGDEMDDITGQAKAALKRRMQHQNNGKSELSE